MRRVGFFWHLFGFDVLGLQLGPLGLGKLEGLVFGFYVFFFACPRWRRLGLWSSFCHVRHFWLRFHSVTLFRVFPSRCFLGVAPDDWKQDAGLGGRFVFWPSGCLLFWRTGGLWLSPELVRACGVPVPFRFVFWQGGLLKADRLALLRGALPASHLCSLPFLSASPFFICCFSLFAPLCKSRTTYEKEWTCRLARSLSRLPFLNSQAPMPRPPCMLASTWGGNKWPPLTPWTFLPTSRPLLPLPPPKSKSAAQDPFHEEISWRQAVFRAVG